MKIIMNEAITNEKIKKNQSFNQQWHKYIKKYIQNILLKIWMNMQSPREIKITYYETE